MPLAAHATFDADQLHIRATWGDPEGKLPLVHANAKGTVLTAAAANALGEAVAKQLQAGVAAQGGSLV
jgi:hydroxymethylbilane synthase